MAHKVRITPEAEADIRSIGDYIVAQHAPESARRFVQSLRRRIASLKTFPEVRHGARRPLRPGELPKS